MKLTGILDRRLIWVVVFTFSLIMVAPPQSRAALVESRTADGQTLSQRAEDLDRVRMLLEHDLVAQRLADYGYSKQEALMKIESASDEQLHQLAGLSDNLAAGADGLGVIVTILVIVLLVMLILKLHNKEIIIR